jgi:predicted ATPase/DNA-binding winged helix-turn-helix (wHTH) protein
MSNSYSQTEKRTFSFGPFVLDPNRQVLAKGTTRVKVGVRSLEILTALVERAGELVTKEELISRVWPDTFVEESNVKVNVAALRRALGENQEAPQYVATANGRGYRFIGRVESFEPDSGAAPAAATPKHNLPVQTTHVVGRADDVLTLSDRLTRHRLVTISGTGGVGKTTVAVSLAAEMLTRFTDGVWFVDLAPLRDASLVSKAMADVVGLTAHCDNVAGALNTFMSSRRVLIVLDNCEHLIGSVAALVDQLIQHTDYVHILATSREPLCVKGEQVYRLPALEVPADSGTLGGSEALRYSGIELFLERAAACAGYRLTDEDVPVVSEICQKLDGIALAIELAAARVDSLALAELSALLNDRLSLLNRGGRTAPDRHRTLTATLDWSYELIPANERKLFRRLSVFGDAFLLESACVVASGDTLGDADIVEGLAGLVAKSLVCANISGAVTQYRLLDTTRAYALQKLQECGEDECYLRRYAEYQHELAKRNGIEQHRHPSAKWLADYKRRIDDFRGALAWTCSPGALCISDSH